LQELNERGENASIDTSPRDEWEHLKTTVERI
jgi:hypothetical protein